MKLIEQITRESDSSIYEVMSILKDDYVNHFPDN